MPPSVKAQQQPEHTEAHEHRRKILNLVNTLDESELKEVSDMLEAKEESKQPDNPVPQPSEQPPQEDAREEEEPQEPEAPLPLSQVSGSTNKTLISSLQQQLLEEKEARTRLEGELANLKRMSLDIQNSLKNQGRRGAGH